MISSFDTNEFFQAALKRSYGTEIKPKQKLHASFCEDKKKKINKLFHVKHSK